MREVFLSIALFFCFDSIAQNPALTNYNVNDGLAGSTVYHLHIDNDGFLWAATDGGLSRFNGRTFSSYGRQEGLHDVEIFKVFPGLEEDLWFREFAAPHNTRYLHHGILIRPQGVVGKALKSLEDFYWSIHFGEQRDSLVIGQMESWCISESLTDTLLYPDRQSRRIPGLYHFYNCDSIVLFSSSGVWLYDQQEVTIIHTWKDAIVRTKEEQLISIRGDTLFWYKHLQLKKSISIASYVQSRKIKSVFLVNENECCITFSDGGMVYLKIQELSVTPIHTNITEEINYITEDDFGNIWIATKGSGIFKWSYYDVVDLDHALFQGEITELNVDQDELYVGMYNGQLIKGGVDPQLIFNTPNRGRIMDVQVEQDVWLASDDGLFVITNDKNVTRISERAYKSVLKDEEKIMVGWSGGFGLINVSGISPSVLLEHRTYSISKHEPNGYAIGTSNGVYHIDENLDVSRNSILPESRVNSLLWQEKPSVLFVAYDAEGLFVMHGDSAIDVTLETGLKSKKIQCISMDPYQRLWIGTNEGIVVASFDFENISVTSLFSLTTNHGLKSDDINAIAFGNDQVWIGSALGLNSMRLPIKDNQLNWLEHIEIKVEPITVNGSRVNHHQPIILAYDSNNVNLSFTYGDLHNTMSYTYEYRLIGLNDEWQTTSNESVYYNNLKPGDYKFEVRATDDRGNTTSTFTSSAFTIQAIPIWKNPTALWVFFSVFVALSLAFIIGYTLYVRNRQRTIVAFNQRMSQLELKALRAQMNPHFIFNSLNAIQSFILASEERQASTYLSKFSKLMRQILESSVKTRITLEDEVHMLEHYIALEQVRFNHRFDFEINVNEEVPLSTIELPGMLIQPFVENAINHGLYYLEERKGKLSVQFDLDKDVLRCVVEDNGVGREEAGLRRKKDHVSRATQILEDRIELLKKKEDINISVTFEDLKADNLAVGTRVSIYIETKLCEQ